MRFASVKNVLRKKKASDTEGYLCIRIGIPGYSLKPKFKALSYRIHESHWDEQSETVKRTHPDYNQINADIAKEKAKWDKIFRDDVENGIDLTPEYVEQKLKPKSAKGAFLLFYAEYLELIRSRHSKEYADHFLVEYNQLRKFAGDALGFSDITAAFLEAYEVSLTRKKLAPTTLYKKMKRLREVIDRAIARGHIQEKAVADYSLPPNDEPDTNYLTVAQTEQIANSLYAGDYDGDQEAKKVAAYFLVECYSGLRLSDWSRFEIETLIKDQNLKVRAKKNGEPVYIPLKVFKRLGKVITYIKRHNLIMDVPEWKVNRILRIIALPLRLKFPLRSHIGRHTCGTLLGELGYNTRQIADVLGISEQTAKRYTKQTRQALKHAFDNYGGL